MNKLPIDQYLIEAFKRNKSKQVHPEVYKRAVELICRCHAEDVFIVFTDGLRTLEDQAVLYGKGRANYWYSNKNYSDPAAKRVSNAQPGQSFHNYGLALDFVTCDGSGKNIDWVVGPKWRRAAAIAKELGFAWGGDWTGFVDYPHIEYNGGLTIAQVQAGKMPTFKPFNKTTTGGLTMNQYNELKKLIDAQATKIKTLEATKADVQSNNAVGASHKEAWDWAIKEGLVRGDGTSTNPAGVLTREQMATMLKRYHDKCK